MTDPKPSRDAALRHAIEEVERWTSPQIGQMLGQLRPAVESGEAGEHTRRAVEVLRSVLARRKAAA